MCTIVGVTLAARVFGAAHLTGTFVLRSGRRADHYFDKYRFESDPTLLRDIVEALVPLVPGRGLGWLIRKALTHYLACPERVRADAETEATLQSLLASLAASRGH